MFGLREDLNINACIIILKWTFKITDSVKSVTIRFFSGSWIQVYFNLVNV